MQKIIIDTNVLISALIQRNYPYFILYNYAFDNLVVICVSDALIKEYLDVINRPKFSKYPDFITKADFVLAQLEAKATRFNATKRIDVIADDPDNRLLELADESKADFIITGNTTDFTMTKFQGTRIVTPKEYWDLYRE